MNITELCVKCNQNNSCTMCWKTSNKKCPHFIQKTNADRIRAMNDEELADFITSQNRGICTDICREMYYQSNLEWLKQPAEIKSYKKL